MKHKNISCTIRYISDKNKHVQQQTIVEQAKPSKFPMREETERQVPSMGLLAAK